MERLKKPSVSLDPSEKLIEDVSQYLGIAGTRTFSELSTRLAF